MHIKYRDTEYKCLCFPRVDTVTYSRLPEDFPAPVSGDIVLCADDGFEMRTDTAENYLRQMFEGGVLTLTNQPEPAPMPESDEDDEDDTVEGEPAKAYTEEVTP